MYAKSITEDVPPHLKTQHCTINALIHVVSIHVVFSLIHVAFLLKIQHCTIPAETSAKLRGWPSIVWLMFGWNKNDTK